MGEYISSETRNKIINLAKEAESLAFRATQEIDKNKKEIEELKRENHLLKCENTRLKFKREFNRIR